VRALVSQCGWNSTSYQIINSRIDHWFSDPLDAVVGYFAALGVAVVAGAPVCAENRLFDVATAFERDMAAAGNAVCYFCAESRIESLFKSRPISSKVLLGAQPVWNPRVWAGIIAQHSSLRAQLHRARNKDVRVSEWTTAQARENPALQDCLDRWLDSKGLPTLRFLVDPDTLGRLFDRRVFVAKRHDEVVGFLVLAPIAERHGWLFEQFPHAPSAPNGTVELMIDAAMRALADEGYEYVTLGLSPLSTRAPVAPFRNPLWLRFTLGWLRLHGKRFYNFNGLDHFKAKLRPERWEPVFAISNQPHFGPRTLYAIASAFSAGSPIRLVSRALWRAVRTEAVWFFRRSRLFFAGWRGGSSEG
jgi:phosphatidylglycerol lysyltransferase